VSPHVPSGKVLPQLHTPFDKGILNAVERLNAVHHPSSNVARFKNGYVATSVSFPKNIYKKYSH